VQIVLHELVVRDATSKAAHAYAKRRNSAESLPKSSFCDNYVRVSLGMLVLMVTLVMVPLVLRRR